MLSVHQMVGSEILLLGRPRIAKHTAVVSPALLFPHHCYFQHTAVSHSRAPDIVQPCGFWLDGQSRTRSRSGLVKARQRSTPHSQLCAGNVRLSHPCHRRPHPQRARQAN